MLYELDTSKKPASLLPLGFKDFSQLGMLEKDLETLINDHLLDVLLGEQPMMPIFRERNFQEEADLYALRPNGELVLFELKRAAVGPDAVHQILRYAQDAGRWTYAELDRRYQVYLQGEALPPADLQAAHKEAFFLDDPLPRAEFNRRQHLWIVGSAADESLTSSVEYWARNGLSIDFAPYRLYELAGRDYFELFALPYDRHRNPSERKGALFDTNRSWDENSVWAMFTQRRVAAYGGARRFADHVAPGDLVFYSHTGTGIIAAAEVIGPTKKPNDQEWYHDVRFLTAVPTATSGIRPAVPFRRVAEVTGKSFYWARTIKVPYLSPAEADALLEECRKVLGAV